MGACALTKTYRDGPPSTPCDTPTVRKALLVIKSHRIRISTKTNFIVMELLIKNTNVNFYVTTYTCTWYYVHTPVLIPKVQVHFALSLPSSMSKLVIRKVAGHVILTCVSNCSLKCRFMYQVNDVGSFHMKLYHPDTSLSHIDHPLPYNTLLLILAIHLYDVSLK